MDKRKKPQTSDEETPRPALLHPSAPSPFRPLSRRRRQQQLVSQPVPAVERPNTSLVFDASPTTIAAVLAEAGRSPAEPVRLAWGRSSDAPVPMAEDDDLEVEPPPPPDAA